jgi:uncharacterized protein (DUF608 family)
MAFDPASGAYVDTRVARGFPLGGIGSGGVCFDADGGFGELRLNNNWMSPIPPPRGAFHALWTRGGGAVVLRRARGEGEYGGFPSVRSTRFVGMLPAFTLDYDDDLPLGVRLDGFTPHVPHDVRSSTLPAAVFRFTLANAGAGPIEAALLFSFENVLGRGGTGHLGLELGAEHEVTGVRRRVVYDSVEGNFQEEARVGASRGVRFRTAQRYGERAHRRSVTGEYLLLVEEAPGLEVTVCDGWNADDSRPALLDDFARDGRVRSRDHGRRGEERWRPAAAVAAALDVPAGGAREVVFVLAWWTPDHVTDPDLGRPEAGTRGVRVGHVYEQHFPSLDAVAAHVLAERVRLEDESSALPRLLVRSSLPRWLVRAIANSIDSTLGNTVVPASGTLYTLEGVDWHWPMGGLTGTNDQRLSSHPYTSVFFPALDASELDAFRRLADARGAIPHGNGNCDLALGSTDVPYGWPMFVKGWLPAKEWTDLTLSLVLQAAKLYRITGARPLLERFWPALVRGMEYLDGLAARGVPEGGTTYDVWDFPGVFAYTATLHLAALRAMADLAAEVEPGRMGLYVERAVACARRLDELWDARGFFRTTVAHDTIFTAALAGDWAARYAGLAPVVDVDRAASHLRHQHRVLVAEAARTAAGRWRPLPRAEARLDGTPVTHPMAGAFPAGEEMTYVWQVLSYQAMEQIYVGLVDDGLETMRMVYDRIWYDGNAWSAGLRGSGESIYMTHPVAWAALNALTGAALDVPRRTLFLSPRTARDMPALACPFFFPPFWAWLDWDPAHGRADVEVLRTFGDPIAIDRIVHRPARGPERTIDVRGTTFAAGRRLQFELGT